MTKNILIVGPAWVGDMVMAQCLFKLLKQREPTINIDVLAPNWSLPLLARMPEVSTARIMPFGHGQLDLRERFKLGKSLRAAAYTEAIVLPNSFKSALPVFWANIPKRTGWRGEMRYIILNDLRVLDKNRYPLMIERFMALGLAPHEVLPIEYPLPELKISPASQNKSLENQRLAYPQSPVLALCPGAEFGPAKRWPEMHYAAIAREKLAEGWQVWLFGSVKDRQIATQIMQLTDNRCLDLTGKTSLDEAVDLLGFATAVVSNDSGLMHIAAALRKPLVALYGPTSTEFTPPLHSAAKILKLNLDCQPCFKRTCPLQHQRCMRDLQPLEVAQALRTLVAI
jgi:heptosyltransferase II